MELTPEQKQEYRKAWQERATRDLKKREARRQKAYAKAKKAAAVMKRKYVLDKIILFSSTVQGNIWEQSDIDLAIQGFADERRYLKLYGDLLDLVSPLIQKEFGNELSDYQFFFGLLPYLLLW